MKKVVLVLVIFLIPMTLHGQQESVSEKIESILSWIELENCYPGTELKLMLQGILKIAVEEIQAAAEQAAKEQNEKIHAILDPIIERERTEKTIWMCIGVGMGTATIVLSLILILGGR